MTDQFLETKGPFDSGEKPPQKEGKESPEKDVVKEEKEQQEKYVLEAQQYKYDKDATKGELNEKTKHENEKDPKSEGKNEAKVEIKEQKEKSEKDEAKESKDEFKDAKDLKLEHEPKRVPEKEPELIQDPALGRDVLLAHADALDEAARVLRHFIDRSERPDLRSGALRNEPDQADE